MCDWQPADTLNERGGWCYSFGPYRLDPFKLVLMRSGEFVDLPLHATQVLLLLVKHAGQLVEKRDFFDAVWPDTFVSDLSLTQNTFMCSVKR